MHYETILKKQSSINCGRMERIYNQKNIMIYICDFLNANDLMVTIRTNGKWRRAGLASISNRLPKLVDDHLKMIFGKNCDKFKELMIRLNGVIFGSTLHLLYHSSITSENDLDLMFNGDDIGEVKNQINDFIGDTLNGYHFDDNSYDDTRSRGKRGGNYDNENKFTVIDTIVNDYKIQFVCGGDKMAKDFSISNTTCHFELGTNTGGIVTVIDKMDFMDLVYKKNVIKNLSNFCNMETRFDKYEKRGIKHYTNIHPMFFPLYTTIMEGEIIGSSFDDVIYKKINESSGGVIKIMVGGNGIGEIYRYQKCGTNDVRCGCDFLHTLDVDHYYKSFGSERRRCNIYVLYFNGTQLDNAIEKQYGEFKLANNKSFREILDDKTFTFGHRCLCQLDNNLYCSECVLMKMNFGESQYDVRLNAIKLFQELACTSDNARLIKGDLKQDFNGIMQMW